jgi:hypothetical protein
MNSKPFLPDAPTPALPPDPIAQGITRLHEEHKAHVATYRLEFAALAEKAWEAHLAKQKAEFLARYKDSHYMPQRYPYSSLDRPGQYRVSLNFDQRLEGLAKVGLFGEMLYVLLARTPGHKTTVGQVKNWMRPYLEVDGNMMIIERRGSRERAYVADARESTNDLVHAEGLSLAFAKLVNNTSMITTEFGEVSWFAPDEYDESEY